MLFLNSHLPCFEKVVIWGHKLHSHTHSYVHNAFYKAFKHLGYETYYLDNHDNLENFDFSNALFITEGQVDQNIPVRKDCFYILHNCDNSKYEILSANNYINLQVYTDGILVSPNIIEIKPCIYENLTTKSLFMPWATDLLPHEIEARKERKVNPGNYIAWVGTIGGEYFGNDTELYPFIDASKQAGIDFIHKTRLSPESAVDFVANAYIAPTIVGAWQKEVGYIPFRIFKNSSYGCMGITNSYAVYKLFNEKIVYDPDPAKLFHKAQEALPFFGKKEREELMDFVKENHTYINRIQSLLDFIEKVKKNTFN